MPPPPKSRYSVPKLLILGLVFHFVYIGTVFDCYFTSPVVHGMKSHSVGHAVSKRLVLIVGDGLRADLLFNEDAFPTIPHAPKVVAPYLKSIAETRGAFGISHTRVPTESRPGHVAIIGGMYEDVSAVTKGWKTNPVDFDSVFNQSSHTFSFGSPDILPMFARGAIPGKVETWCYNEEDEDFTKDATFLDIWVFDRLKELFQNATNNITLNTQLRSHKVIFFLHLLGLDTTGHSYRPHSREYLNNIQVVDNIVRQTENLINEFYHDKETSFIFTADHGMSVIGNHGDGDLDNTRTPLIAWGRGIRGPLPDSVPSSHDSYSKPWGLGHLFRRDVEQADLAALMASLIGIDWPVNSVGVLPDIDPSRPGYLSPKLGDESLAQMAFVNAKVILEQYTTKHELKRAQAFFYKPFVTLEGLNTISDQSFRLANLTNIERLIQAKDWHASRLASAELIRISLNGLHYLQTYDRFLIRGMVTFAYIGWAAYTSLYIFRPLDFAKTPEASGTVFVHLSAAVALIGFWTLFALQHAPFMFYVYVAFPCYFWHQFLQQEMAWLRVPPRVDYWKLLVGTSMTLIVIQAMVVGYTHRFIWSIGFIFTGIVWPVSWPSRILKQNLPLVAVWGLLCLSAGVFPVLPVEKKESLITILVGGCLILLCGGFSALWVLHEVERLKGKKSRQALTALFLIQATLVVTTMIITASSVKGLQAKQGLPLPNRVLGWTVLAVSPVLAFASGGPYHTAFSKFLAYFLGFGPCFVILSISVEGLFYVTYSFLLATWVVSESIVRNGRFPVPANESDHERTKVYSFQPDDLRIALFFLFFVQVGFFGTGNVASISSFYLEPVYRLIPIFNPFFMAALLIFKIVAPYIILAVASALLNDFLHFPPFSLLLVALALTDGMTITFFFNVRDTGSWLEIGQSITFFCITSLLLLWSTGICVIGEHLLADVIHKPRVKEN
ncbi:GPI ethanolamine phosphate transferase 1 [Termitomyces sp. T112]|nr:GPI ethanolamine phosphate transferase 1 [Termitomyces sp. T112]